MKITIYDSDGCETEHQIPHSWEICDRCSGNGTHDPEAFSQGFSREDFDEDPGFAEDYRRGVYDVRCGCCGGSGKVQVPAVARCTKAQREVVEQWQEQERERRASERSDRVTAYYESGGACGSPY